MGGSAACWPGCWGWAGGRSATASGHRREKHWGGDYPYFARTAVERELDGLCVFLNGPCGDLAPAEEFPHGDYEVNCSIIAETGLRTLIEAHLT